MSHTDSSATMPSNNPLRALPRELMQFVREYHSDRVQPHPSAILMKECEFTRSQNDLYVKHGALTHLTDMCADPTCWVCRIPSCCCENARRTVRPIGSRQFRRTDFEEPDRYMASQRPATTLDSEGNAVYQRGRLQRRRFSPPVHTRIENA
jgi:hypothetical protein